MSSSSSSPSFTPFEMWTPPLHAVLTDAAPGTAFPVFELDDFDAPAAAAGVRHALPPRVELRELQRSAFAPESLELPDLHGVDLNCAPSGFAERDDRFLAHTTLPDVFRSSSDRAAAAASSPLVASWNPLSSKLAELLESAAASAGLGDGDATEDESGGAAAPSSSSPRQQPSESRTIIPSASTAQSTIVDKSIFPSVACEAAELKQLVTAPFVEKPVMMMVHRIGDTMLLDAGTIAAVAGGVSPAGATTAKQNRKKALAAKIVYFSIAAAAQKSTKGTSDSEQQQSSSSSSSSPFFSQVLRWKFDDLSALVGTQAAPMLTLPDDGRVSLLLKDDDDAEDPAAEHGGEQKKSPLHGITKLEVMEHWLDNVVASVPNVAVCAHRDGVVQGFQVIPTEMLPSLGGFEPVAVLRHSHDVLRWLQATTRDGNSYVLLKDPAFISDGDDLGEDVSDDDDEEVKSRRGASRCGALRLFCIRRGSAGSVAPSPPTSPTKVRVTDIDASSSVLQQQQQPSPDTRGSFGTATTMMTEFDYPLAMMCFRMAQSLSVADAEVLRLFTKSLALFHDDDATVVAFRAAALVSCAEHLRAASPLADAESLSLRYARDAIAPLATIFTRIKKKKLVSKDDDDADDDDECGGILPISSRESVYLTAVRLTRQLLKLLTGFARSEQQKLEKQQHQRSPLLQQQEQYLRCMRSLALAQAVLMLRCDEIPSGLLQTTNNTNNNNNNNDDSDSPASHQEEQQQQQQQQQQQIQTQSRDESSFLLEVMSGFSSVVGDIFHSLLVTIISDSGGTASSGDDQQQQQKHTVEAILKMASVTGQDVGLNILRRFFPSCAVVPSSPPSSPSTAAQQATTRTEFAFPPQIDLLGYLDSCSCDVTGLYEAASAAYNRAAALIVREKPETHREISRKAAGLDSIMGSHLQASAAQLLSAPEGSAEAARVDDRALQLLEESKRKFLSARAGFAAHGDAVNELFMIVNVVKGLMRRAEIGYRRNSGGGGGGGPLSTPVGAEELSALLLAKETVQDLCSNRPEWGIPLASSSSSSSSLAATASVQPASSPSSSRKDKQHHQQQFDAAVRALRLQYISVCLALVSRSLSVVGPGTSFSRETTFAAMKMHHHHQQQQQQSTPVSRLMGRHPARLLDDPSLSVRRLLLHLQAIVLDEFALPALKVAKLLLAGGNNVNNNKQQAIDVVVRCHLILGELLARFTGGVPFPGSRDPSNSPSRSQQQQQQQQQQYDSLLMQQQEQFANTFSTLKLAAWAEAEFVGTTTTTTTTSASSATTAGNYEADDEQNILLGALTQAATHFKVATMDPLGPLVPATRHGLVSLYHVDVQLKRARHLLLQAGQPDACLEICLNALSVIYNLAPWVEEQQQQPQQHSAGGTGGALLLTDCIALMVQERLHSVLMLVLKYLAGLKGSKKDEGRVTALKTVLQDLLQAATKTKSRTRTGVVSSSLLQRAVSAAFIELPKIFTTFRK